MHVPLKCWTKKKWLCLVCKYFFLSHSQPNAGSCFVLHICCFMTVLKVSDAAVSSVLWGQVTHWIVAGMQVCLLPECPEDFRDAGRKTLEVLRSKREIFSLKTWINFKRPLWSCVANMDFCKSIYRNGWFFLFVYYFLYSAHCSRAGEHFSHECSRQENLP